MVQPLHVAMKYLPTICIGGFKLLSCDIWDTDSALASTATPQASMGTVRVIPIGFRGS